MILTTFKNTFGEDTTKFCWFEFLHDSTLKKIWMCSSFDMTDFQIIFFENFQIFWFTVFHFKNFCRVWFLQFPRFSHTFPAICILRMRSQRKENTSISSLFLLWTFLELVHQEHFFWSIFVQDHFFSETRKTILRIMFFHFSVSQKSWLFRCWPFFVFRVSTPTLKPSNNLNFCVWFCMSLMWATKRAEKPHCFCVA